MTTSNTVLESISKALNNPTHSDVTLISSSGTPFHGHLIILNGYTPFFTSALSLLSGFTESKNSTITLPEHTSDAILALLSFCYTGNYTTDVNTPSGLHCRVVQIADYVLVPQLVRFAVEKTLATIKISDDDDAEAGAWKEELPPLIDSIYNLAGSRNDDAKQLLVRFVAEGVKQAGSKFLASLGEVTRTHAEFVAAVLEAVVENQEKSARYYTDCHRCNVRLEEAWDPRCGEAPKCGGGNCGDYYGVCVSRNME